MDSNGTERVYCGEMLRKLDMPSQFEMKSEKGKGKPEDLKEEKLTCFSLGNLEEWRTSHRSHP